MADIDFYCAICGQNLQVNGELGGELVECPACFRKVPVPGLRAPEEDMAEFLKVFPPEVLAVEIKFLCHRCHAKLRIDARWEGREHRCPACRVTVRVPLWSRRESDPAAASSGSETRGVLTADEIAFLSSEPAVKGDSTAISPAR